MKRAIILVSALALCLGLAPAAHAADATNPTVRKTVVYPFAEEFLPGTVELDYTVGVETSYSLQVFAEGGTTVLFSKDVAIVDGYAWWRPFTEGNLFNAGDPQRTFKVCVVPASEDTTMGVPAGDCDTVVLNSYNGTRPILSGQEVFPYVVGGRPDVVNVAFTPQQDITDKFGGYSLQVYKDGTTWFSQDKQLWKAPVPAGNSAPPWNPMLQGDVLKGIGSRSFMVCIYPSGTHLEDTDTFARWCTDVTVTHFQQDKTVTKKRWGKNAASVVGTCRIRLLTKAVGIRCGKHNHSQLRYRLKRPNLGSEDRVLASSVNWKGRYFRLGESITLVPTKAGALVTANERFWGKVRWVSKTWTIRTEF